MYLFSSFAILFAILPTQDVQCANILAILPHVGKSHFLVFEPLMKELARRGHHVTVASFFPQSEPLANYTDISLEEIAEVRKERINLQVFDNPNKIINGLGLQNFMTQILAFQPLSDLALKVCSGLVNFPPLAEALQKNYDVVLVENFNSDCALGLLHVYGVNAPIISLVSGPLLQWSYSRIGLPDNPSYVPTITSRTSTIATFLERLENTALNLYFKLWFRYAIQVKERAIIERRFWTKIPDLDVLARNVSMILVNTFHSLNGVRPLLPGLVEVGGMHIPRGRQEERAAIPQYIERFLNESEHGVVLFSWGSLIKTATIPKYKEEIIVNALSKLKQRVIWKYENSNEEGTLSGNILKVKWIPQYELLQHEKVIAFIAHGGLLGMTEAISAGKPMLIVPFYGDQMVNGAAATTIGLGKAISYADMSEKSLLEGLQSVLSPEMRMSARRASKIWQDRIADPLDTAVYWVERVIRWGHQDPLHSTSKDMGFIEYNLLDVAAVILLSFVFLILVLRIVLNQILRLFGAGTSKKEKLH
ncbi:UDP-glucuronosyltransferase 2B1-like isoform X1 [Spodoptera litura]|uniref:UDP-glucuronosyltransferase n=1 Tax=Spodoptera litura TaxID=69820 RepID=A0A9J7DRS9_SPOLT|nr:UDP-glucuronosyltransferase 2B1-like isoform X1 [Spodoptera litura]